MSDDVSAVLPLPKLPAMLRERIGARDLSYRALHDKAQSARLPAFLGSNGRWYWYERDLPEIASTLGLKPQS